jgi:hypothetical protein
MCFKVVFFSMTHRMMFGLWCRIHLPFYLKLRSDGQAG